MGRTPAAALEADQLDLPSVTKQPDLLHNSDASIEGPPRLVPHTLSALAQHINATIRSASTAPLGVVHPQWKCGRVVVQLILFNN